MAKADNPDMRKQRERPPRHVDTPGYAAIHSWLRKHKPKSGTCHDCGRSDRRTQFSFHDHSQPLTRNLDDYAELCDFCHSARDGSHPGRRWASRVRETTL